MFADCKLDDVVVLDKRVSALDVSLNGKNEIFEYVKERRNGRWVKCGVVLAQNCGGFVKVAFSKCNEDAGDKFDVIEGLNIARERIEKSINDPTYHVRMPDSMARQMRGFCSRSFRYFKGVTKVEIV